MNTPFQHIILTGIQGSGKWTQSKKIVEHFGYHLFETGAELRKITKTNTPLGNEIRSIIDQGHYVPSRYIRDLITHFIETHRGEKILFDGPIRSIEQDTVIRPIIGEFSVIHLKLDPEIAIDRLIHRRVDAVTGEVFSKDFKGDTNPRTGNPLITRADDTPESIKNRIAYSLEETLPLMTVWEKDGHPVYHIDANRSIDTVFSDISSLLQS